jgi:hypothetical protein
MQTIIQVIASSETSLRDRIVKDRKKLEGYYIRIAKEQQPGRKNGWAKLHSTRGSGFGALNLKWDAATKTLIGRVVNRAKGRPDDIVGDFCAYLLSRFRKKIALIQIFQT